MRRTIIALLLLMAAMVAMQAQIVNPVHWKSAVKMTDDTHGVVTFTATIDPGWHLYDTQLPDGGPVPTSVEWKKLDGVKLDGGLSKSPKPHEEHDATFDMTLRWWTSKATLSQRFTVTGEKYAIDGTVRYMACNDETCTAPSSEPFNFKGEVKKPAEQPEEAAAADTSVAAAPDTAVTPVTTAWQHCRRRAVGHRQRHEPVAHLRIVFPGRTARFAHTLRVAHHSHDGELLPQEEWWPRPVDSRCHHLRLVDYCHLRGIRFGSERHFRRQRTQRFGHQCRL